MSSWGIVRKNNEIWIKIKDDFLIEEGNNKENYQIITLNINDAKRLAEDILKEINGNK